MNIKHILRKDGENDIKLRARIKKEHQNADLSKTIKRLQEQLKEANDLIISVAAMPRFPVNPELCREYLEKWGVK